MLFAPVVGDAFQSEVDEHPGALGGAALLRVEGDDAPGDEVFFCEVGGRLAESYLTAEDAENAEKN